MNTWAVRLVGAEYSISVCGCCRVRVGLHATKGFSARRWIGFSAVPSRARKRCSARVPNWIRATLGVQQHELASYGRDTKNWTLSSNHVFIIWRTCNVSCKSLICKGWCINVSWLRNKLNKFGYFSSASNCYVAQLHWMQKFTGTDTNFRRVFPRHSLGNCGVSLFSSISKQPIIERWKDCTTSQ